MKTLEELKKQKAKQKTFKDRAAETIGNIPSSTSKFVSDTLTPLLSPIDTLNSVAELGLGVIQAAIPEAYREPKYQKNLEMAEAVGEFYVDRYGSFDKAKETFTQDPVGFMADVAIPLSLARIPLKTSNILSKTTKAIDPTNILLQTAKNTPKGLAVLNEATVGKLFKTQAGIGDGVLTDIFKGAQKGKETTALMRAQMAADKSFETALEPVISYKKGLDTLAANRAAKYREGMANLKLDKTKVNPQVVLDNFNKTKSKFTQATKKGEVATPEIKSKMTEIQAFVDEWVANPDLHTVEGLDFLKRSMNDFMPDATKAGNSKAFVSDFENNIRNTIVSEFPEYTPVMKLYEESITLQNQVKKALGSGKIEDVEAIARKLQATTRNNVNTSFGLKGNLLDELAEKGNQPNLRYQLAAGSTDSVIPKGLGKYLAGAGGLGGLAAASTGNLPLAGLAAASTVLSSPRLLGEGALRAGQFKGAINPALNQFSNVNSILNPIYNPTLQSSRVLEASGIQQQAEEDRRREYIRNLQQGAISP
tara:strand:- start:10485 stop:12089 length:1605 start_codon:yes stop_codon:yes gene_type:complete